MRTFPPSLRPATRLALSLLLIGAASLTSRASEPQLHDVVLTAARVSTVDAGRLVITMDASGDLRGLVTLKLDVDAQGSITGGDWALVSSYVEDLNPDGTVATPEEHPEEHPGEPEDPNAPHEEHIRLVDNGTLGGSILGGSLSIGPDGSPNLSDVQLALTSGTLTFAAVTTGAGTVAIDLTQANAQGNLRLTF
jgi:hypothetical protein